MSKSWNGQIGTMFYFKSALWRSFALKLRADMRKNVVYAICQGWIMAYSKVRKREWAIIPQNTIKTGVEWGN